MLNGSRQSLFILCRGIFRTFNEWIIIGHWRPTRHLHSNERNDDSSASIWDFQHSYRPSFSRISCRIKRTFKLSPCAARHGRISTPKPLIKIENKNISARGTINYCSALSHVLRTFRNRKGMKNYKSNRDSFVIAHMKLEMKFDRAQ